MTALEAFAQVAALTLVARLIAVFSTGQYLARFFDRVTTGLILGMFASAVWVLMPLPTVWARIAPLVALLVVLWVVARVTARLAAGSAR